jgi:hypothetical protein
VRAATGSVPNTFHFSKASEECIFLERFPQKRCYEGDRSSDALGKIPARRTTSANPLSTRSYPKTPCDVPDVVARRCSSLEKPKSELEKRFVRVAFLLRVPRIAPRESSFELTQEWVAWNVSRHFLAVSSSEKRLPSCSTR